MERKEMKIVADVDGTLRAKKNDQLPAEMRERVFTLRKQGVEFYLLTGAPAGHVPREISFDSAFAEFGGVRIDSDGLLGVEWGLARDIEILRKAIGVDVSYGAGKAGGLPVFLEGPRWTSLALLTGRPAHCFGFSSNTSIGALEEMVKKTLVRERLPLHLSRGEKPGEYSWLDITATTKEATVAALQDGGKIFYLGDGENDLEAMRLPGVIPVGFRNSVLEIRRLACQRGVYIDKPGPYGGALEFFNLLLERRLG